MSAPDQIADKHRGVHAHHVGSAHGGVRGDRIRLDLDYVAGEDERNLRAKTILETSLVSEGEVSGSAEGYEGCWNPIGVRLPSNRSQYDIAECLTDVEVSDVLGHGRSFCIYIAFNRTGQTCYSISITSDRGQLPHLPMDKRTLAKLVDAYADAKASRNEHLVNSMVAQLEQALDAVFPDAESPAVDPEVMGSEF